MPCLCWSPFSMCGVHADASLDVFNKVDAISLEQVDKLAHQDHTVVISCEMGLKCVSATICHCAAGD